MKIIKVAIYVRVSKKDQSVEQQLDKLRKYCELKKMKIVGEFIDEGISAVKQRPQFDKMMNLVRRVKKRFDAVLVWKFDRFARSTRQLLESLDEFKALSIDFISFSENIDTTTPYGEFIFTILGAVGKFERSLIAERTKLKLDYLKSKNIPLGRSEKRFDVRKAYQLRKKGLGWRKIEEEMNCGVSYITIRKVLRKVDSKSPEVSLQNVINRRRRRSKKRRLHKRQKALRNLPIT